MPVHRVVPWLILALGPSTGVAEPPSASLALCDRVGALLRAAAPGELDLTVSCPASWAPPREVLNHEWHLAAPPVWAAGPARVVLRQAGGQGASVAVPVIVQIRVPAWVTRHAVMAGELLSASDLEWRRVDLPVGGVVALADRHIAPQGRALLSFRAGEVVRPQQLAAAGTGLRGDPVVVHLQSGGLHLETSGVLMQAALVGQVTRVQLKGRRTLLDARMTGSGTVMVEK